MTVPDPTTEIDVSRRQVLLSSGSVIAGAGVLSWAATDNAAASNDIREIDIPPTEVETPDGTIDAATATVTGSYQYSVNDADETRLQLKVAPPKGEYQTIDDTSQAVNANSGSGQYTLNGSILDHDKITPDTFAVEPEQERTITLPVRVTFTVLYQGESVVHAMAEAAADVVVQSGEIVASAAVLGEGEIAIDA